jgi:hypothetical protein
MGKYNYYFLYLCNCAVMVAGHYEINHRKSLNGAFQGFSGDKKVSCPQKVLILCKGTI